MRIIEFKVQKECDGISANTFLKKYCGLSSRMIIKLKKIENGITSNGKLLRTVDTVFYGDVIKLKICESCPPAQARDIPIDIVYEDEDIFVCNKPANMPVHPSRGHADDTLANAAAAYLEKSGQFLAFRPINRLDRDTSGLVLCAKNSHAASNVAKNIEKTYFAICQGKFSGNGIIDLPIRIKKGHGIQREVGQGGERAITHYKTLCTGEKFSLIELTLETGRTHQIRVHFSHLGFPLAGDDMYGGDRENISRQALHCGELKFKSPVSNKIVELKCPVPDDMRKIYNLENFIY